MPGDEILITATLTFQYGRQSYRGEQKTSERGVYITNSLGKKTTTTTTTNRNGKTNKRIYISYISVNTCFCEVTEQQQLQAAYILLFSLNTFVYWCKCCDASAIEFRLHKTLVYLGYDTIVGK